MSDIRASYNLNKIIELLGELCIQTDVSMIEHEFHVANILTIMKNYNLDAREAVEFYEKVEKEIIYDTNDLEGEDDEEEMDV